MSKVSVVIIAKNEEKQISDCLKSVQWADEIVILDDYSTDKTVEIAREYTNAIQQRKMDVEGTHRNYAYSLTKNEWVLSLDCDERVTPELATEIDRVLESNTDYNAYAIPIKTFIGKRWVRYAGYYPARKTRLFKKSCFRYEDAGVHPRIFLDGKCGDLEGDILHYAYEDFADVVNRLTKQTTLEARKWIQDGRKVSFLKILRKFVDRFIKFYFLRKGYKDGLIGFMFSFFHSLYQLLSYAQYWEMKHGR
ncbi:MAG: glycosyltransferase family 2 protein [Candidatus Omnitrophica bacterium]|nr:glycosyltransferase family 2 protein [Candidatus Omnitrophota bacterium]